MDMLHKITTGNDSSPKEMKPSLRGIHFKDFSLAPIVTNNVKLDIDDILASIGIVKESFLIARGSYTKVWILYEFNSIFIGKNSFWIF